MGIANEIDKCRKKRDFESRLAATIFDNERRRARGGFKHYPYLCKWCGQWHLTKHPPRSKQ